MGALGAIIKTFCTLPRGWEPKFVQLRLLELTRRYLQEQLEDQPVFTSPEMVADYLSVQMRDYRREVFVVLLLDSKHQLLDNYGLFQGRWMLPVCTPGGGCSGLRMSAAAVIVAHNHPSVTPSKSG